MIAPSERIRTVIFYISTSQITQLKMIKLNQILSLTTTLLATAFPLSSVSANFEAASAHIDLDGSMVGYMDFEGDGQEIGTALNDVYQKLLASSPQMPPIPVDFTLLFDTLGFGSVKAVAMSTKEVEPGLHRNRSVALLNGELSGLYALYDTVPLTFTAAQKAPADASGAITASINLAALRDTASLIMQQIMGPMGEGMIQQQLTQVLPGTDVSYSELIDALSGKWDGFWLQNYGEKFEQELKFWVSIEGAGSLLFRVRATAEEMGVPFFEEADSLSADFSHLLGDTATISLYAKTSKETGRLILYTNKDWTDAGKSPRLVETEAFKNLANRLPSEGIAFSYAAATDLSPLIAGISAMPQAAQYTEAAEALIELLIGDYLKPNMAVTIMDGDAMVSDQYASFSTKQAIVAIPTITIAGVGVGAAMAIPAFHKVRSTSQEKAVTNNLRQIASAADQYFLEEGKASVRIEDLIGPNKYIRSLTPVAGENYEGMILEVGKEIKVTLGNGKVISLPF
jgi:hypothetical protein